MVWVAPSLDHNTEECYGVVGPRNFSSAGGAGDYVDHGFHHRGVIVVSSWCYVDKRLGALLLYLVESWTHRCRRLSKLEIIRLLGR
jgi:hypothetical protein